MLDQEVREVLDKIDEMLVKDNDQAAVLWDILSAIRGPDGENGVGKTLTIEVRQKAFPKLTELRRTGGGHAVPGAVLLFTHYNRDEQLRLVIDNGVDQHFLNHVLSALRHLGDGPVTTIYHD